MKRKSLVFWAAFLGVIFFTTPVSFLHFVDKNRKYSINEATCFCKPVNSVKNSETNYMAKFLVKKAFKLCTKDGSVHLKFLKGCLPC